MVGSIVHRGPDQQGVVVDQGGKPRGIGTCRLAIVDIDNGDQPFSSEDGRIHVSFNGEIYNFSQLRQELLFRGSPVRTSCDTEVILRCYQLYGEQCFQMLEGMFAVAIWDQDRDRVLLARDRLGQKPIFYRHGPEGLIFASELKALLASGMVPFQPSLEKLSDFLTLGYTPGPGSVLENVESVLPGTFQVFNGDGSTSVHRYWSLKITEDASSPDLHGAFLELFDQAVQKRLMGDDPVGLFLSAGVDSSAILASMKRYASYPIKALTATFQDPEFDEAETLLRSSLMDGVDHEVVVCSAMDTVRDLDDMVLASDNLLANPAMIPLNALSRRAQEHGLKVVLTGGGADELLFGYPTYLADRVTLSSRSLDSLLQKALLPAAAAMMPLKFGRMPASYIVRKYMETHNLDPLHRHFWWRTIFTFDLKRELLLGTPLERHMDTYERTYRPILKRQSIKNVFNRFSLADLTIWWQDMGLYMADCIGMAHSLESRAPFMDHRLVEFIFSLPVRRKWRGVQSKPFLRKAVAPLLPPSVRRRRKLSFAVPLGNWLAGPLYDFTRDRLSKAEVEATGLMNYAPVERLLREHRAHQEDHSYKLWNLLCFIRWFARMRELSRGALAGTAQ